MVGLAPETSSTVTILRPGRETKLKVSAGRDRRASRSLSWYSGFDHSCQKPETACGFVATGQESKMAIRSFKVGVSTPHRSEMSKDLIMPAQSRSTFWTRHQYYGGRREDEIRTKLVRAVISAFTSQRVRPSTAARDREEMISIAWAAVGVLSAVMPNLDINAWTESGSLVMSGPRSSRVWTRVEPGGRLKGGSGRRNERKMPVNLRNGWENALKDG